MYLAPQAAWHAQHACRPGYVRQPCASVSRLGFRGSGSGVGHMLCLPALLVIVWLVGLCGLI